MLQLTQTFKNSNQKGNSTEKQNGYWDGLFLKILDNLQVKFKTVHIRIESPFDNNHTSLGVSLEEMFLVNTNEFWQEKFIDRKIQIFLNY